MYLIESTCKKNPTYITWTMFINILILFNIWTPFKVAPRVEKTKVFKKDWNFASCSCFANCIMKKVFLLRRKETALFPYFHYKIIFCSTELFECPFNFKFRYNIFICLTKLNIKGARFEFYKKQQLILGAAVYRCSRSKLSGPATLLYWRFYGFWSNFFDWFTKTLKVRKIFWYVTFYQYFFLSEKIFYHNNDTGNLYN